MAGVAFDDGVAVGAGLDVGVAVAIGVGDAVGRALAVGDAVGVGALVGIEVGLGAGEVPPPLHAQSDAAISAEYNGRNRGERMRPASGPQAQTLLRARTCERRTGASAL
jgi:hypothetical protein